MHPLVGRALALPWVKQGDWAGSLLLRGQVFLGLHREVPAWTGVEEGTEAFLQAGSSTWLVEGAFERFAEAYLARVRERPREILDLAARFERVLEQLRALEGDLAAPPPSDPRALAAVAERYARVDMAAQPYSYVFGYGEDAIVGRLVRDLAERGGADPRGSSNVAQALLLAPIDVPTETQAAQEGLLAIVEEAERAGLDAPPVHRAILAHAGRFAHLGASEVEVQASARALLGRAGMERERRRREVLEREEHWEDRVRRLRLGPEDLALLRGLRRQVGVRTVRREAWLRARAAYEPWLRAMEGALGLGHGEVHLLTHEELLAALRGGPRPDVAARAASEHRPALLAAGGALLVVEGGAGEALRSAAEGRARPRAGRAVLLGVGASPGRAVGVVRIVAGPREQGKVAKGDILVADMTEPDLVLACERAAAIVTDLGGLLCHAAIVSRELGIPCVLATGDATRTLRDGDLVEVDGDAGEVRVLVRAHPRP
jgi:phosphohistidine swiveling domain-containing protein